MDAMGIMETKTFSFHEIIALHCSALVELSFKYDSVTNILFLCLEVTLFSSLPVSGQN
jgi:hypothetical protein